MKKIRFLLCKKAERIICLSALILCLFNPHVKAQFEVIGSNEYGRMLDVTYDPNTENKLYAISYSGYHIFVSLDNGESWDIFYSSTYSLQDLKIVKNGSALSFVKYLASSTENKLTILDINTMQETNLGLPNAYDYAWIDSYSIYNDDNTDVILLNTKWQEGITNFGKTFYTTTGGMFWMEVYYTVDNHNIFLSNVAISPDDPQKLFLLRAQGNSGIVGGIMISEDGGETWTEKLAGNVVDAIDFNPTNSNDILVGTGYSFGAPERLYRSLDNGDTWNEIPISWSSGIMNNITAIRFNPSNPNHIVVLEENEVVISEDNGETWQQHIYDPYGDNVFEYYYGVGISFNPFQANELCISSNFFPFFSEDGGATLTRIKSPFFASTGQTRFFSNGEEKHLYYGVQSGYVHRNLSNNEENTFDIMALNMSSFNSDPVLFIDDELAGRLFTFSSGWSGATFAMSNDHGETKTSLFEAYQLNANYISTVAICTQNRNIIWASFASYEGTQLYKIDFSDISNIQRTEVALPENDLVNGIYISPENSDHLMIAVGYHIYKSIDGGESWNLSSAGLEDFNYPDLILSLAQNSLNPQQFAFTSNKGIFISYDGGNSWTKIYNGLAHNLEFSPQNNGVIVAFCNTTEISVAEIIYTANGGTAWNTISNNELYDIRAYSSAFDFFDGGVDIYTGSSDLGAIKYGLPISALTYTISAIANAGGTIEPSGTIEVSHGDNKTFTFTPDADFEIASVLIDGENNPEAVTNGSYTFENITENHSIEVVFEQKVGINDALISQFNVYPNPAKEVLNIYGQTDINKIEIINIAGRIIYTSNVGNRTAAINVSDFAEGYYFVKIYTDKNISTAKIIIGN